MGGDARRTHHPSPLQLGGKLSVATNLNLAYTKNVQAQTPTVVAREAPLGGIRLVCCERGYPS